MSPQLVWLITGTSSGFGHAIAKAALQRGDKVIATSRSVDKISDLHQQGAEVLELHPTEPLDKLKIVAKRAVEIHGKIDVVVNNAGYAHVGALEETTPEETYAQFNINVFGPLNVARAFLPYMREAKSGTILWLGSVGGWIPVPFAGAYSGSKHAVRGIAESLHTEISSLGLRSIYVEPGYFRTNLFAEGHRTPFDPRIEDYKPGLTVADQQLMAVSGHQPGDPDKAASIIVDFVKGEGVAANREVPLSLPLGPDSAFMIEGQLDAKRKVLESWGDIIRSTNFPEGT